MKRLDDPTVIAVTKGYVRTRIIIGALLGISVGLELASLAALAAVGPVPFAVTLVASGWVVVMPTALWAQRLGIV